MEEEEDLDRLRLLFHACDANNSGRIEKEEFFSVCSELKVHPAEIECIFTKLDVDRDGSINFEEFANGFEGVSDLINLGRMESDNDGDNFRQAWEAFQQRLGEEAKFIPSYKVIPHIPRIISLLSERYIVGCGPHRREREAKKAEAALGDLKRQYDSEVCELQVKMKKLKMVEEQYKHINLKDEVVGLKRKINELTLENQQLKRELLGSQTNIAFLQSELDSLKCEYADQSLNLEQDKAMIKGYTDERDNLARQIGILQSANRKLHDSNDGLRSTLENSLSKYNKSLRVHNTSPGNTISYSSPKFSGRQSPFNDRSSHSSYMDEDCDMLAMCDPMRRISCEVESLAESCFDSGLSTLRDSNDCDSEVEFRLQKNFQRSHETPENFGGDASDTDVPEIHDEVAYSSDGNSSVLDWKPTTPINRRNSLTSVSTRKCISAISPQAYNALFCETSAKDGSNVIEAVLHLARNVKKQSTNKDDLESVTNLSGVNKRYRVLGAPEWRMECRMRPIAWMLPVQVQAILLPTVDRRSQEAVHNLLSAAQGEARVSSAHHAPVTPVVWLGACRLACKLPRAALSSDAVALRWLHGSLQSAADGTRFRGQSVFVFAAPK
ncbi:UNVERIFIED_CONTAM: hypothetical protein FKN15_067323 [Acipenser sinensis]